MRLNNETPRRLKKLEIFNAGVRFESRSHNSEEFVYREFGLSKVIGTMFPFRKCIESNISSTYRSRGSVER